MYNRAKYKDDNKLSLESIEDPVGSIKYDGGSYFMQVQPDGDLKFFSRRESVKGHFPERSAQLPHLTDKKIPEFAGHVVNVELIHTGHSKEDPENHAAASGILNSLPEKAIATQKLTGPIRAVMFDVIHPRLNTYEEKLNHIHKIEKALGKPNLIFKVDAKIGLDSINKLIAETAAQGREGVVVTSLSKPEDKNTRLKIKHFKTYNLRVTGITQEIDIRGNPKNSAGALELADATGRNVGKVGTGLTRDLRQEIYANPKAWIGKLIQVKAMDPTANKLRHPIYNGEADGELDIVK